MTMKKSENFDLLLEVQCINSLLGRYFVLEKVNLIQWSNFKLKTLRYE